MVPRTRALVLALIAIIAVPGPGVSMSAPILRPAGQPTGLTIDADPAGVRLRWASPAGGTLQASGPPEAQIFALELPDGADPAPQIQALDAQPWAGDPPRAAQIGPRELADGSVYAPLAGFAAAPAATAPLAMLREGRLRGRRIAVYRLSPVYAGADGARIARALTAAIPGAAPLASTIDEHFAVGAPFLAAAPAPSPLAARQAWTIRVAQAGMQSLSAAALGAAGLKLATVDPAKIQIWRGGVAVPAEELRSGEALSELRFYAPAPGDRWNSADTYWLTVEAGPGARMAARDARSVAGPAPASSTALARGVWRANALYESRLPGPDGDHYFAADMRVAPLEPGQPAAPATAAATIAPDLPLAAGAASLTVAGESLFATTHVLSVTLGGAARSSSWSGTAVFSRSLSFPAGAGQAQLALLPGAEADGIHLDSVAWELPVQLSFAGKGARFAGRAGSFTYQLGGLPAGAALYDVSDPAAPARLTIGSSSFATSAAISRDYLLAGPGTLRSPPIAAHAPDSLSAPLNAQAIYIAPAAFAQALAPLAAQRRAQGYSVAVVTAESIYDGWGHGQVRPQAIRDFLRYAAATWAVRPIAVTLVGDGSSDPRNYLGIGQASWIPPYLAPVDPWLGETACETCFAQLDGDSPLDDLLPDLLIGRLPVKSAAELSRLIVKITGYENGRAAGAWRGRAAYIADNADTAGDFAAAADLSAAEQPAGVTVARLYYDPAPPQGQPWRERDPLRAFDRTLETFDAGAAVLSYMGHGLQYQWAVTGPPLQSGPNVPQDRPYLLNVDFAGDAVNGLRLPIVLSLTCLSGAFQQPSVRGTTIDEALLLNPRGGAVATWSSSGLGVLYGHDALQSGFLRALWRAPAGSSPRLGALALAGLRELFSTKDCCQESLRTYGLLGDPLTPARVQIGAREVSLPLVRR